MAFATRPAKLNDLSFIQDCANAAYEKYISRIGKKPAPMVADFASQIATDQVEIILFQENRAGYCVSFTKGRGLFIENIALLSSWQGKGLASEMFTELESRARSSGLAKLELYTNAKMTENLAFYTKLGFLKTKSCEENGFQRVYFEKPL